MTPDSIISLFTPESVFSVTFFVVIVSLVFWFFGTGWKWIAESMEQARSFSREIELKRIVAETESDSRVCVAIDKMTEKFAEFCESMNQMRLVQQQGITYQELLLRYIMNGGGDTQNNAKATQDAKAVGS